MLVQACPIKIKLCVHLFLAYCLGCNFHHVLELTAVLDVAANLLKPMLARGELRCIGATTLAEHRQHMEKDAAFERRFQQVLVGEPSVQVSTGKYSQLVLASYIFHCDWQAVQAMP